MAFRYFIIHKPFGVLSQFSKELPHHTSLGDVFDLPGDVYPVGRLDKDSEGLLLLTNDPSVNKRLLDPENEHPRSYHVQVEGIPDKDALEKLAKGIEFSVKGKKYLSKPAKVGLLTPPPQYPERIPPVRFRKHIPTSWLELTLYEGKNRQVRRMCAAVGFPVLRLIRSSIGAVKLNDLQAGEFRELDDPGALYSGDWK
jgi:23S rRNA pseudouridine2457 synthase